MLKFSLTTLAAAAAVVSISLVPSALKQTPAKWDVQAPFGPTVEASFDTTEGTWMNVDVSPDGRRIVFDILGDIYTMPIEVGKLADLVVLDRNPLENIRYTDSVFRVVLNGRVYDTSLAEVGGAAGAEGVVYGEIAVPVSPAHAARRRSLDL